MFMSGVGIGGMMKVKTTAVLLLGLQQALAGCFVAVVGAATRGTRASPTAAGTARPAAATIRVFVFPGLSLRIVPLNPCTPEPKSSHNS